MTVLGLAQLSKIFFLSADAELILKLNFRNLKTIFFFLICLKFGGNDCPGVGSAV